MPAMSLFNETVQKVSKLEAELDIAHQRIRSLEIALKAARADKINMWRGRWSKPSQELHLAHNDLNALSEKDVEELFRQHRTEQTPHRKWWQFWKMKRAALMASGHAK